MKKLKEIVAKVLKVDPSILTPESSPENIESWDSLNALLLVTELETNYNLKFTMDEIISTKNFGDIVKTLREYGVNLDEQ